LSHYVPPILLVGRRAEARYLEGHFAAAKPPLPFIVVLLWDLNCVKKQQTFEEIYPMFQSEALTLVAQA